jgi:hypothetical protein
MILMVIKNSKWRTETSENKLVSWQVSLAHLSEQQAKKFDLKYAGSGKVNLNMNVDSQRRCDTIDRGDHSGELFISKYTYTNKIEPPYESEKIANVNLCCEDSNFLVSPVRVCCGIMSNYWKRGTETNKYKLVRLYCKASFQAATRRCRRFLLKIVNLRER